MKTKLNTYIIFEYVFKPVEVFKTPGYDIIFSVLRYVLKCWFWWGGGGLKGEGAEGGGKDVNCVRIWIQVRRTA